MIYYRFLSFFRFGGQGGTPWSSESRANTRLRVLLHCIRPKKLVLVMLIVIAYRSSQQLLSFSLSALSSFSAPSSHQSAPSSHLSAPLSSLHHQQDARSFSQQHLSFAQQHLSFLNSFFSISNLHIVTW